MTAELSDDDRVFREELAAFERTAARLEGAYAELQRHAATIDGELAESNRALAASKAQLDLVLDSIPLAVFRLEGDASCPLNAPARDLLERHGGVPRANAWGAAPSSLRDRGADGQTRDFELRRIQCEASTLLLVDDRTEWSALERLGGLAELALGIAHEVRNPLNGLAGFASLLRRNPSSSDAPRWAERIEEGAKRLEGTVRALLDFARPDRMTTLRELEIDACLRVAREEIEVELDPRAAPLRVQAASCSLEQAFANLARNSREAGATRLWVQVDAMRDGRVVLVVRDDGPGIAEDVRDRIFDPFVGTKESSSGLGLAFTSRVFSRIGASIRLRPAEASPSVGACFEVELPIRAASQSESPLAVSQAVSPEGLSGSTAEEASG